MVPLYVKITQQSYVQSYYFWIFPLMSTLEIDGAEMMYCPTEAMLLRTLQALNSRLEFVTEILGPAVALLFSMYILSSSR